MYIDPVICISTRVYVYRPAYIYILQESLTRGGQCQFGYMPFVAKLYFLQYLYIDCVISTTLYTYNIMLMRTCIVHVFMFTRGVVNGWPRGVFTEPSCPVVFVSSNCCVTSVCSVWYSVFRSTRVFFIEGRPCY